MEWRAWLLPGSIVSIALAVLAVALRSASIEADLTTRGNARLAADGQPWASVVLDGRDATLVGTAPSVVAQRLARESAGRLLGFRVVDDDTGLIPVAAPFVWTAERNVGAVAISGSVPDPEISARLGEVGAAAMPELAIHDATAPARGSPANFAAAADLALHALADLREGRAEIRDNRLAVSGTAKEMAEFQSLPVKLSRGIPPGFRLTLDIQPPPVSPYVWSATLAANRVRLSGYTPAKAVQSAILAVAAADWPKIAVLDDAALASGAPSSFEAAARFALSVLARLSAGEATLDGLEIGLSGRAASLDDHEALRSLLSGPIPEGFSLGAIHVDPPIVSSYFFRADRTGQTVTLSGYVPSDEAKAAVLALAAEASHGADISSRLLIADGAPIADWVAAAQFALGEFARMDRGFVAINGQTLDFSGIAASPGDYAFLRDEAAKTPPAGIKIGKADIAPPAVSPFRLSAGSDNGKVVLDGYVPTAEAGQRLSAIARRKFGQAAVTNRLIFASGETPNLEPAAEAGLQALSRLDQGRFDLIDTSLTLRGAVLYPGAGQRIEAELAKTLPPGITFKTDLTVRPPGEPLTAPACQARGRAVLAAGAISFIGGTAALQPDAYGVLDRLAAVLRRCPSAKVEIGDHTDSSGTPSTNLALSKARAEAVAAFVGGAGILRERLSAVGYGDTRPIASNATDAGRAQNGRVELSVQE